MKAYQLLSRYYERKVAAAVAAEIYAHSHKGGDRMEAERLADEVVEATRRLRGSCTRNWTR